MSCLIILLHSQVSFKASLYQPGKYTHKFKTLPFFTFIHKEGIFQKRLWHLCLAADDKVSLDATNYLMMQWTPRGTLTTPPPPGCDCVLVDKEGKKIHYSHFCLEESLWVLNYPYNLFLFLLFPLAIRSPAQVIWRTCKILYLHTYSALPPYAQQSLDKVKLGNSNL